MKGPLPEQKRKMLQQLVEYYGHWIDMGFSGRIITTLDKGILQWDIRREQNDRLGEVLFM